jgi:hypothetical protein
MKARPVRYTADELAWVKANCHLPRATAHAQFCARFDRQVSVGAFGGLCKRNGWLTGRRGCFEPGQVPANKGQKMPWNANSAATRFYFGHRTANAKPLGHERLHQNGYILINIDRANPHTGYGRSYVFKHHWMWEAAHGPIPKGHVLKCLDGDKTNCDPSNWQCVPRALLPRLNGRFGRGYDAADPALKPTILAITKLEHAARALKKAET